MRFFGVDINLSKNVDKRIDAIEKKFDERLFRTTRPTMDKTMGVSGDEVSLPYYPLSLDTLYSLVAYSDVLRTVHKALRTEIFRNGYVIKEKFAKKCVKCGKEFSNPVEECDECGSTDLKDPDTKQKRRLETFCKNVNDNNQTLLDVFKQINDDIETVDDGYALTVKEYTWDIDGNVLNSEIIELIRLDPRYIRIIADNLGRPGYTPDGKKVKTCLIHRNKSYSDADVCPMCGRKLQMAYYRAIDGEDNYIYYVKDEVIHTSKYMVSLTYGFSPIFSIWLKVITLINQDKYIKDYYTKQRPNKGLLFIKTPNMNSLQKAWSWMLDMFKKNPHMIPPIAVESESGGNFVQFVDLMKSLNEMQYGEGRNEYRRVIGSCYGVMPLFQADLSQGGGLNSEGLQITVTNRSIAEGQRIYNDKYFIWLLNQSKVTDYILELEPSEERDEAKDLDLEAKKISNARMMQSMGYDVTLNEDGEFEYEPLEEAVEAPQPQMPGFEEPLSDNDAFGGEELSGEPDDVSRAKTKDKKKVEKSNKEELRKKYLNKIVDTELNKILKATNTKLDIRKVKPDKEQMVNELIGVLFATKFSDMSKATSVRIKDYLLRGLSRGYSITVLTKRIKKIIGSGATEIQAERIARTEIQALQNKSREWSYKKADPKNKFKFRWSNPLDHRTTEICERLVAQTKHGVSMDRLKALIEKEAKDAGFEPREWVPHINCRSKYFRIV